jgi:hypothetical protein
MLASILKAEYCNNAITIGTELRELQSWIKGTMKRIEEGKLGGIWKKHREAGRSRNVWKRL